MAMVYRVRHTRLGSRHALKVLTVTRPNVRKRLLREGRVQAELHHPNLVGVTDVLDIQGSPALLMEYVDGPSLEWVLRNHRLNLEEGLALFRGICSGVAEAHQRDLVHRDLKPGNVLLARRGEGWLPKVTDFGIAKILQGSETPSHTGSQVAMGTPAYMAPEQIRDARSVDQRADIFSLGVLLYELSTGVPPFFGPDVLAILNAVATADYVPPLERDSDLPPHIAGVIDQCLRLEPSERIQSCEELLDRVGGTAGLSGRTVVLSMPLGYQEPTEAPEPSDPSLDEEPAPRWESTPDDDFLSDPTPPILPSRARTLTDPVQPRPRLSETATVPLTTRVAAPAEEGAPNLRLRYAAAAALLLLGLGLGYYALRLSHRSEGALLTEALPPPAPIEPVEAHPALRPAEVPRPVVEKTREVAPPKVPAPVPPPEGGFLFPTEAPEPALPWDEAAPADVSLSGAVRSAQLVGEGGALSLGAVPPGEYQLEVDFGGEGPHAVLSLTLRADEAVRITCNADKHSCKRR